MSVPPCGVYPGSGPRQCKSEAEARFYDQLRSQLPADHYAWHRIDVITNRGEQGEADFVVAKRGAGILVVEVKGGRIEERDGVWYQNGRKMDEAPLDQARRAAALIERRFIEVHKRPPPYECLTAFPDSEFESAPSNDYLRQRTLDANGVRYLREQITASFKLLPHFRHETEDDSWINFIHERLWGPIFKGMLSGLVQTDKSQREQLDDEQLKIIGELERNRRVIVEGPPGSGKPIIAVEAARRIADRGKPGFYPCFTEALAASVRSELEQRGVQAYAIKRLAEKFLQQAGKLQLEEIPAQLGTQEARRFYESVSERALNEAADEILGARAAAVVIDEAQDFQPDDWLLAKFIAGDESNIWALPIHGKNSLPRPKWTRAASTSSAVSAVSITPHNLGPSGSTGWPSSEFFFDPRGQGCGTNRISHVHEP